MEKALPRRHRGQQDDADEHEGYDELFVHGGIIADAFHKDNVFTCPLQ
jgi:hypothetical protein